MMIVFRMRQFFIILLMLILFHHYLFTQDNKDIVNFYPTVNSLAKFPELFKALTIIQQRKIDSLYVTFIGYKNQKKFFIGAITKIPIHDPNTEISRIVEFQGSKPFLGKVSTWGYIFDRNKDGKIDYAALVGGAAVFKNDKIGDKFPPRNQRLDHEQTKFFVSHCEIIFNHWADDNFDGNIDAVIHADMDPSKDLVEQMIVVRSTKFDNSFDDVWAFREDPQHEHKKITHTSYSVPFHPLGSTQGKITKEMLAEKSAYLQLFNKAAAACNIKPSDFGIK